VFEFLIPFSIGYFTARLLSVPPRHVDRILGWDTSCLGWRPVVDLAEIKPDGKYLACYEIDGKDAQGVPVDG
jgi:hypothetical protein